MVEIWPSIGAKDVHLVPMASLSKGQSKALLCFQLHRNDQVMVCRLCRARYFINRIDPRTLCARPVLDASFRLPTLWTNGERDHVSFTLFHFLTTDSVHSVLQSDFLPTVQLRHVFQAKPVSSPRWIAPTDPHFLPSICGIRNYRSPSWPRIYFLLPPRLLPCTLKASRHRTNTHM